MSTKSFFVAAHIFFMSCFLYGEGVPFSLDNSLSGSSNTSQTNSESGNSSGSSSSPTTSSR